MSPSCFMNLQTLYDGSRDGALTEISIFMASRMRMSLSCFTMAPTSASTFHILALIVATTGVRFESVKHGQLVPKPAGGTLLSIYK